jgi:hypothetical protein
MMSSCSLRTSPQRHSHYQYTMLPSKDGSTLRAVSAASGPPTREREDAFAWAESESLYKEQAMVDLKPSRHRDT